jgi:hypothetical protein
VSAAWPRVAAAYTAPATVDITGKRLQELLQIQIAGCFLICKKLPTDRQQAPPKRYALSQRLIKFKLSPMAAPCVMPQLRSSKSIVRSSKSVDRRRALQPQSIHKMIQGS